MRITVAGTAGFCFGVNRAVEMAMDAAGNLSDVYMLGQLIHNDAVTARLLGLGVRYVETLDGVPPGASVIVRAHGVPKGTLRRPCSPRAARRGRDVPVCAEDSPHCGGESRAGRLILIMGDPAHPEVIGISGWCRDAVVLKDAGELEKYLAEGCKDVETRQSCGSNNVKSNKVGEIFVNNSKKVYTNLKIFDTICNATDERQSECARIASESEVMLVIGDGNSSNTRKLEEVAGANCAKVYRIDGARELNNRWFENVSTVGITAGASTPAWIIKEVVNKMSEEMKNQIAEEAVNEAEENF